MTDETDKVPHIAFDTKEELDAYIEEQVKAAQVLPDIEFTISANAANKLNLGNYSSADRGVFMSKKLLIPAHLSQEEKFNLIREETKKLQLLCEAQLAGIVAEYMGKEGFDDSTWTALHKKIFTKAIRAAKACFGIVDPPA